MRHLNLNGKIMREADPDRRAGSNGCADIIKAIESGGKAPPNAIVKVCRR